MATFLVLLKDPDIDLGFLTPFLFTDEFLAKEGLRLLNPLEPRDVTDLASLFFLSSFELDLF
jgi:hypothetical protein